MQQHRFRMVSECSLNAFFFSFVLFLLFRGSGGGGEGGVWGVWQGCGVWGAVTGW